MGIEQDIQLALIQHFKMPSVLQRLCSTLRCDLYYGPLYTDGRGNELCFGEPGARQFDFSRAVGIVRDWLDEHVYPVWYDAQSGCVSDTEPEPAECDDCHDGLIELGFECPYCDGRGVIRPNYSDWRQGEPHDIARYLLGRELAITLR